MPLFSIITVTLNPPAGDLQKTLESILDQGFEDWELIIKDGGSEAGVLNSVPNDPRIRMIVQKDSGIFDAMNQSLEYAGGAFVCFLNAGDTFFDSRALQAVAEAHEIHTGKDFFYGDVSKPQSRSGFELYSNKISRSFLFMDMICHQAWFVRRSYYEAAGGFEIRGPAGLNPAGADYRFLLRMILIDRLTYQHIPHVLVSYQGGGYSLIPEQLRASGLWKDQQRDALYGSVERFFYRCVWRMRNVAKSLVYDRGVWRIWRKMQERRVGRN